MPRFSDNIKEGVEAREKLLSQRLEREIRYLKKWEKIRTRKWRYVLLYGIMFGVPTSFGTYMWSLDFSFTQFVPLHYAVKLFFGSLSGIGLVYGYFWGQDRRYLEVKKQGIF